MTQRCLKAIARTLLVLGALATGAGMTALHAQTGKIEGRVRNPAGEPIPNATVVLEGTAFTATTSSTGYYFIENVPAGLVQIQAQYVGYRPKLYEGLRVTSGQTITQDFTLEQAPVTVQEIVTVVQAENPLVPRDQVTSREGVNGAMVAKLPVDRISAALAMQAGVVQVTNCGTNGACSPQFSVRGSRIDENSTYIDGVPVQSAIRGVSGTGGGTLVSAAPSLGLAVNAFEDASITTGAASAEFGNAEGGVLNYSTRTGGTKFSGNLNYETAELGGQTYGQGYNVFQGSLGGPVMKNLTFFISGRVEGTNSSNGGYQGSLYPSFANIRVDTTYELPIKAGTATSDSMKASVYDAAVVEGNCQNMPFVVSAAANAIDTVARNNIRNNYGVSCNANQSYSSPSTTYYTSEKLNYSYGKGSRLAVTYNFSGTQSRGTITDGSTAGTQTGSNVATINLTQTIFRKPTHQLSLDAYLSWQWNNSESSRLTAASEAATRSSPLGIITHKLDFTLNQKDEPVDSNLIYNYLLQTAGHRIGLTDSKNTTYASQYGGVTSFSGSTSAGTCPIDANESCPAGGGGTNDYSLSYTYENRLVGKADFDWQIDRYNRMKIGGQFTNWQNLSSYNGGSTSTYSYQPINRAAYAEDRLDLGDLVLVGGLRYDYFWTKIWDWNEFPEISSRPGFTPDSLYCPVGAQQSATAKCALVQAPSHNYVSPHIQVAFPVTDKTNFRLSYAQAAQQPDIGLSLLNANCDINIGCGNSRSDWGQDLDFGKTIKFEFGARHAFSDDMVLDVAVYNNDVVADPAIKFAYPIDPVNGHETRIYTAQNTDFGNTRGIELTLDRRIGSYLNGRLDYTYEDSRNTGTDATSYIGYFEPLVQADAQPPTSALPTGTSRPQNLAAQFTLTLPADWEKGSILGTILHKTSIFVQARIASGTPYTRCEPGDVSSIGVKSGSACALLQDVEELNAARLPTYKQFDMRLTRDFRLAKYNMTAYLDGRNILNLQNITSVWAVTGTTTNGAEYAIQWTNDSSTYALYGRSSGFGTGYTDGSLHLPTSIAGCAKVANGSTSYAASCYYYIRSEERFGNGDGIYTLAEQHVASNYAHAQANSISGFVGASRTIRFGLELNF